MKKVSPPGGRMRDALRRTIRVRENAFFARSCCEGHLRAKPAQFPLTTLSKCAIIDTAILRQSISAASSNPK